MREFSPLAIILGVLIGVLLAAASAFVGLKVGMTISASIPAAVMSLLIMRTLLKRGTLLENNMVQTVGSAGESVATGMIFTLPALFILGQNPAYMEMA
ncbi:MAG: OPT/YSL family transporter, partial [Planctomycetota bacterium]